MSDTPRTDYEIEVNQLDPYEADWPRKLERENDQLVKQCVKNVEEIGELRAALVISEKKELAARAAIESWKQNEGADAARFEWLIEYATRGASYIQCMGFRVNNRESIDAAMEATNNEQ